MRPVALRRSHLDRKSRRFTWSIFTALQARLGAVGCDTNVIAVSYQYTGSSSITPVRYCTAQALEVANPLETRCKQHGAATGAEAGRLRARRRWKK
jgi:hypothetical protein